MNDDLFKRVIIGPLLWVIGRRMPYYERQSLGGVWLIVLPLESRGGERLSWRGEVIGAFLVVIDGREPRLPSEFIKIPLDLQHCKTLISITIST